MTHAPPRRDVPPLALELTRRHLMAALGVATVALTPAAGLATQEATPPATVDLSEVSELIALSRSLCGGGIFNRGMAAQLLTLISSDPGLKRGLDALLAMPDEELTASVSAASPAAGSLAAETDSAAVAILTYWYVGYFQGNPIVGRSDAYDNLIAWQAMYTPPFADCKEYGGWAKAPQTRPRVLGA